MAEYKDKFIAFIDILGFKNLVEKSVAGRGMSLPDILALLEDFGNQQDISNYNNYGPIICPHSKYIDKRLDFRLTQASDCAIISVETSPAGVINLLSHCATVVLRFLYKGLMCRGYVTRGYIYHSERHFIGTGYQSAIAAEASVSAFKKEADEKGTPFVEIDSSVSEYIATSTDECIRTMYARISRTDGNVSAIFPFERLLHAFSIGGTIDNFNPHKEHHTINMIRSDILTLKKRVEANLDAANTRAAQKTRHYLEILDKQLEACDEADDMIDMLYSPYPSYP